MEQLLQTVIVALLVAASATFAMWRLIPARTKLRALSHINSSSSHTLGRWLARLKKSATNELAHGCSTCSKSSDHVKKHSVS